jgi:hypothetical protein
VRRGTTQLVFSDYITLSKELVKRPLFGLDKLLFFKQLDKLAPC